VGQEQVEGVVMLEVEQEILEEHLELEELDIGQDLMVMEVEEVEEVN